MNPPECKVKVRVSPNSKQARISLDLDGTLRIAVTAPPHHGQANEAARHLLAKQLRIAPSKVQLVHGASSRWKTFEVEGWTLNQVQTALEKSP